MCPSRAYEHLHGLVGPDLDGMPGFFSFLGLAPVPSQQPQEHFSPADS